MGSIEEMAAMFGAGVAAQLQDWEAQYGDGKNEANAGVERNGHGDLGENRPSSEDAMNEVHGALKGNGNQRRGEEGSGGRGKGGRGGGRGVKGGAKRRGRQQSSPCQAQAPPQKKRFRAPEAKAPLYSPQWMEDPWLYLFQTEKPPRNDHSHHTHARSGAQHSCEIMAISSTNSDLDSGDRATDFAEHQQHLQAMHEKRSRGQRGRAVPMQSFPSPVDNTRTPLYSSEWLKDPWEELLHRERGAKSRGGVRTPAQQERPRPPLASQLPILSLPMGATLQAQGSGRIRGMHMQPMPAPRQPLNRRGVPPLQIGGGGMFFPPPHNLAQMPVHPHLQQQQQQQQQQLQGHFPPPVVPLYMGHPPPGPGRPPAQQQQMPHMHPTAAARLPFNLPPPKNR